MKKKNTSAKPAANLPPPNATGQAPITGAARKAQVVPVKPPKPAPLPPKPAPTPKPPKPAPAPRPVPIPAGGSRKKARKSARRKPPTPTPVPPTPPAPTPTPTPWTTQQLVIAGIIAIIALFGLIAVFMAVMPKTATKQASGGSSSYVPTDFVKRFADMTGPVPAPANGATSSETRGTPTVPKIGKTSVDQTTVPKNAISGNGNVIGILGNVTGNSNTSITINNYPARHTMALDGISVPSGLNRLPDTDGIYRWKMEIGSDTSVCYTTDTSDWLLSFEATAVESDITIHVRGHDGVWQPVKLGTNIGSVNCTGLRFTMKHDARESADLSFVLSVRK